jgi:hypothetical protein
MSFSKVNCCLKLLMTLGILFLWPFVCFFITMLFGCIIILMGTKDQCRIWRIPGNIWKCHNKCGCCSFKSCCMNIICLIPLIIIYLIIICFVLIAWLLVIAFYATVTLLIGGIIYSLIVIPTWILIWFVYFRKLFLWNGDRTYKKNKRKALL